MNTPAARSVSFAVAPPAPAADSIAARSPSAGLNAIPIAPHHPDRDHCPSSLSTDPYAQRHVDGAIHRRAINSPPKSPLRSTRRSPSIPVARVSNPPAQRLDFTAATTQHENNNESTGQVDVFIGPSLLINPNSDPAADASTLHEGGGSVTSDDPEDNLGHYYHPDYEDIPTHQRSAIEQCCLDDFGVASVREFQIQSINAGAFYDNSFISINAKTGYGKSLVALAIASMRRGVSIIQVPLLGLGTDQVAKAIRVDVNIEAWHIDEFRGPPGRALRKRLMAYTQDQRDNMSIILYMSPRSLLPGSDWMPVLRHLATQNFISLLCVDEAHMASLHGSGFRPEFNHAITSLKNLYALLQKKCPRIVMSATYRETDQQLVEGLFGDVPDFRVWTDMCRRRIYIDIVSSGTPTRTCTTCIKLDLRDNPTQKIIWYTNSKTKAEESLVPAAENVLDTLGIEGEAMACTGGAGLPEKAFMMATFRGDDDLFTRPQREELADLTMDDEMCDLVNTSVLVATAAAQCGISSDKCHRCYRIGTPANLYDLVQEMGRTDRYRSLPPGDNRFEVHVSWPNMVHLYVRIMRNPAGQDRDSQMVRFHELMKMIFAPEECFHVALETYFERRGYASRPPCRFYCSFCSSDHADFAGTFRKAELISVLSTECFNGTPPSTDNFHKTMKRCKSSIYEPDEVPKGVVGPIHGLCLQLLANGIIDLDISQDHVQHRGKETLVAKHIVVKSGTIKRNGAPRILSYLDDESWNGTRFIERALDATNVPKKVRLTFA